MKLRILLILFLAAIFSFAQEKNIKSGIINLKNNEKVQFSNLRYEGDKVFYTNSVTQQVEHLYLESIVSIEEGAKFSEEELQKIQIQTQPLNNIKETPAQEKIYLTYKNSRNILLDGEVQTKGKLKELLQNHPEALKKLQAGRSNRDAGTVSMALGGTIFLLNGMLNLTAQHPRKDPTTYFFVGGGIALIGLVFNITGSNTMKKAVSEYNQNQRLLTENNQIKPQLNLAVGTNGARLTLSF